MRLLTYFASFALLVVLTDALSSRTILLNSLPGKCPELIPYNYIPYRHFGVRWYSTHSSFLPAARCTTSRVDAAGHDEIINVISSVAFNGEEIEEIFPSRQVPGISGLYESTLDFQGIPVPQQYAIILGETETALVWGCAQLPDGRHFEYATVSSKIPHTSPAEVYKFSDYLRLHGSRIKYLHRLPIETCSVSANSLLGSSLKRNGMHSRPGFNRPFGNSYTGISHRPSFYDVISTYGGKPGTILGRRGYGYDNYGTLGAGIPTGPGGIGSYGELASNPIHGNIQRLGRYPGNLQYGGINSLNRVDQFGITRRPEFPGGISNTINGRRFGNNYDPSGLGRYNGQYNRIYDVNAVDPHGRYVRPAGPGQLGGNVGYMMPGHLVGNGIQMPLNVGRFPSTIAHAEQNSEPSQSYDSEPSLGYDSESQYGGMGPSNGLLGSSQHEIAHQLGHLLGSPVHRPYDQISNLGNFDGIPNNREFTVNHGHEASHGRKLAHYLATHQFGQSGEFILERQDGPVGSVGYEPAHRLSQTKDIAQEHFGGLGSQLLGFPPTSVQEFGQTGSIAPRFPDLLASYKLGDISLPGTQQLNHLNSMALHKKFGLASLNHFGITQTDGFPSSPLINQLGTLPNYRPYDNTAGLNEAIDMPRTRPYPFNLIGEMLGHNRFGGTANKNRFVGLPGYDITQTLGHPSVIGSQRQYGKLGNRPTNHHFDGISRFLKAQKLHRNTQKLHQFNCAGLHNQFRHPQELNRILQRGSYGNTHQLEQLGSFNSHRLFKGANSMNQLAGISQLGGYKPTLQSNQLGGLQMQSPLRELQFTPQLGGIYQPGGYQPEKYQPTLQFNQLGGLEMQSPLGELQFTPQLGGMYQPGGYQPGDYQPGGYQPGDYQPGGYQPGDYQPRGYQPTVQFNQLGGLEMQNPLRELQFTPQLERYSQPGFSSTRQFNQLGGLAPHNQLNTDLQAHFRGVRTPNQLSRRLQSLGAQGIHFANHLGKIADQRQFERAHQLAGISKTRGLQDLQQLNQLGVMTPNNQLGETSTQQLGQIFGHRQFVGNPNLSHLGRTGGFGSQTEMQQLGQLGGAQSQGQLQGTQTQGQNSIGLNEHSQAGQLQTTSETGANSAIKQFGQIGDNSVHENSIQAVGVQQIDQANANPVAGIVSNSLGNDEQVEQYPHRSNAWHEPDFGNGVLISLNSPEGTSEVLSSAGSQTSSANVPNYGSAGESTQTTGAKQYEAETTNGYNVAGPFDDQGTSQRQIYYNKYQSPVGNSRMINNPMSIGNTGITNDINNQVAPPIVDQQNKLSKKK